MGNYFKQISVEAEKVLVMLANGWHVWKQGERFSVGGQVPVSKECAQELLLYTSGSEPDPLIYYLKAHAEKSHVELYIATYTGETVGQCIRVSKGLDMQIVPASSSVNPNNFGVIAGPKPNEVVRTTLQERQLKKEIKQERRERAAKLDAAIETSRMSTLAEVAKYKTRVVVEQRPAPVIVPVKLNDPSKFFVVDGKKAPTTTAPAKKPETATRKEIKEKAVETATPGKHNPFAAVLQGIKVRNA